MDHLVLICIRSYLKDRRARQFTKTEDGTSKSSDVGDNKCKSAVDYICFSQTDKEASLTALVNPEYSLR